MKYLNKIYNTVATAVLVIGFAGCSLYDLDVNKDPNSTQTVTPNLLLTNIETSMASNLGNLEGNLETFAGIIGTQGLSRFDLSTGSFNNFWNDYHSEVLLNIVKLQQVASVAPANVKYVGLAKLLRAYSYVTLVDLFGDVPFTEAAQGDKGIAFPKFDTDKDIYDACFKLVDEAIVDIAKGGNAINGDLIYGGDVSKWLKMAKSLKLRMYTTAYKAYPDAAAKIKSLVEAGGLLTSSDDFQFQFSKDPVSVRHPWYTGVYTGLEFDFTYIGHQIVYEMLINDDPRYPYYFKRQAPNAATSVVLDQLDATERGTTPCSQSTNCDYGYMVLRPGIIKKLYTDRGKQYGAKEERYLAGLFGRDRGDGSGIPADGDYRLAPGVYPCGGFFDDSTKGAVLLRTVPNGAPGGGIFPMLTNVNQDFYLIEAILKLGLPGSAKDTLARAIRSHISKVTTFGKATDATSILPTTAAIDTFVARTVRGFDAQPDNDRKLDYAMKQLWYCSYGNGFDLFNAMRRTGYPTAIQKHLNAPIRNFPRRLPYPQSELSLNPNAAKYKTVKFDSDKIFWDK
jgi:hypothetical protein